MTGEDRDNNFIQFQTAGGNNNNFFLSSLVTTHTRQKGERLAINHEMMLKDNNGGRGKAVKPGQRIVGGGWS